MKELSIEEKAKAYDEIIERLKDFQFEYRFSPFSDVISDKFPELKENEDEKIRKGLIAFFNNYPYHNISDKLTAKKCIAWLEKQGETFTKKDVDDAYLKGICDAKHELEKQGKQNPTDKIEPKFKVGDIIKRQNCSITYKVTNIDKDGFQLDGGCWFKLYRMAEFELSEQNPADEVGNYDHKEVLQTIINEQKPAWSEEDEQIIIQLRDAVEDYFPTPVADKIKSWLKSLRPQNTWRPSDEQMIALEHAINCYSGISPTNTNEVFILEIMKEQLKKLREE